MANVGIEKTTFTLDVIGRFTCNADWEALAAISRPTHDLSTSSWWAAVVSADSC